MKVIVYIIIVLMLTILYGRDIYQLFKNLYLQRYLLNQKRELQEKNKKLQQWIAAIKDDNSPHIDYWIRKNLYYCKEDELEIHFKKGKKKTSH